MVVQVLGISGSPIPNRNTGIDNLGSMVLLGNVPCIRCGYGEQCELSEKIRQAVLHEPG